MKNNTIKIIKRLIEEKINSDPDNYPNVEKIKLKIDTQAQKYRNKEGDGYITKHLFNLFLIYNKVERYRALQGWEEEIIKNDNFIYDIADRFCKFIEEFLKDLNDKKIFD